MKTALQKLNEKIADIDAEIKDAPGLRRISLTFRRAELVKKRDALAKEKA